MTRRSFSKDYLVPIEDIYDAADNAARSMGITRRHNGGHMRACSALVACLGAVDSVCCEAGRYLRM